MAKQMNMYPMNPSNKLTPWIFLIPAFILTAYVLFMPPRPGVADQGDFQRIMDIAGLAETEHSLADPNSQFYYYVKAEYRMEPANPLRLLGIIPSPSLIYPITLAKSICKISGMTFFNTAVLAIVYSAMYITSIWLCLKWLGIDRTPALFFLVLLALIVLLDGNYLIWFNSLYGEPVMIIGLLYFIASVLYVAYSGKTGVRVYLPVILSSLFFISSKAQCITALPFIVIMISRIPSERKNPHFLLKGIQFFLPIGLLLFYAFGVYSQHSKTGGVDTKYNSVFYGILKNTDNPIKDLEMLGLSEDLAVEAGKHAYLPPDEYVKYVPWSEITEEEFNQKISNFKLIRFYLLNPRRLLEGMKYTASQSLQTGTFLGKYTKADLGEYTYDFTRFTFWSGFRSTVLPGTLWFITLFYLVIFIVSGIEYKKKQEDKASRLRIELLWVIMAIGIFQFPMPYVGNGEADTAKQLFLFNFIFDILIIITCTWVFNKLFFFKADRWT
ncbi:MAG: hypothetical protein GX144_01940 [Clostridiaceae bacterium]|jgi:hypothetical protein|nr:hypothetical protein [Clostridiaceae bacterium]